MNTDALDDSLRRLRVAALRQAANRLELATTQAECEVLSRSMPLLAALDEIARRRRWWFQRLLDVVRG